MNKKFTFMVAALLAAGSVFAVPKAVKLESNTSLEITTGFKFYLGTDFLNDKDPNASNAKTYVMFVKEVETKDKQKVWTIATSSDENAIPALFEIRELNKKASNAVFELWANGNKIYAQVNGIAATKDVNSTDLYSEYYVENAYSGATDKFTASELTGVKVYAPNGSSVMTTYTKSYITSEKYTEEEFKSYNGNIENKPFSLSFNYETENLEGNVFTDMVAVDVNSNVVFVKGDAEKIAEFSKPTNSNVKDPKYKDLQFIAVQKDAKYDIDAIAANEGLKLVWVSGETLAKPENNDKYYTEFTINEADCLNAEGELTITVNGLDVNVGAVRPSATDNTTYVTTVATTDSKFTASPAILGSNEYLPADILLKKGEQSVVSIYFTSGKPETEEYHKYLSINGSSYVTKSYVEADPTLPENQWVVVGFDGKFKFTFANRADKAKTIELTLAKGGEEGGYTATSNKNITDGSGSYSVKFLPIAVTRTDGYLALTEDQVKEGIKLSFTGKTDLVGEKTFYAVNANNVLIPSLEETGWDALKPVVKVNTSKENEPAILSEYNFACLDDKGNVTTSKKDTIYVPAYHFMTVGADTEETSDDKYLSDLTFAGNTKGTYAFAKTSAGYVLTTLGTTTYSSVRNEEYYTVNSENTVLSFAKTNKLQNNIANSEVINSTFAVVKIDSPVELNESLPAVPGHYTFDNERGSINVTDIKGINEGALASEGLVFWLDTADIEKEIPSFYVSYGIKDEKVARNYMFNPIDSARVFDEATAKYKYNDVYFYGEDANVDANTNKAQNTLKAAFAKTAIEEGKDLADEFKFNITLAPESTDEYILTTVSNGLNDKQLYVAQQNGVVILTEDSKKAMAFTVNKADAPTSNEGVSTSEVAVVANNGSVVVKNAAGKNVVVSTILGQVVANEVLTSDNATINVPAGIVVVAVDGESFKVSVK